MMIDKRLINTVEDSKKWIAINVLWNWVALIGGIISAVVFAICLQWAFERTLTLQKPDHQYRIYDTYDLRQRERPPHARFIPESRQKICCRKYS